MAKTIAWLSWGPFERLPLHEPVEIGDDTTFVSYDDVELTWQTCDCLLKKAPLTILAPDGSWMRWIAVLTGFCSQKDENGVLSFRPSFRRYEPIRCKSSDGTITEFCPYQDA